MNELSGSKLREALDDVTKGPRDETLQDKLLTSAKGRNLHALCDGLLRAKGEVWYRMRSELILDEESLGIKQPILYLASPTTIWIINNEGEKERGIKIRLARPDEPFLASNLLQRVNFFGRYIHALEQEGHDMATPFLVVYDGQVGQSELWRHISFSQRSGTISDLFRKAILSDVSLFAGAVEVLQQTL